MNLQLPFSQTFLRNMYLCLLVFALASTSSYAQNASNGGQITGTQTLCVGDTPTPLTDVVGASGGNTSLAIQYLWMMSTNSNGSFSSGSWSAASGDNMNSWYQPGNIVGSNTTVWYTRCARRAGFTAYIAESNVVSVSTLSAPTVIINGNPGSGFAGLTVNFNAAYSFGTTSYSWDFNGDGFTDVFNNQTPSYTYTTPGTYNVSLTVTSSNGCSLTTYQQIVILPPYSISDQNPCNCNDPQNIVDLAGSAYYMHDFARIYSNTGDTWTITNILNVNPSGGDIFNSNLGMIGVGMMLPEVNTGIYQLPLWFNPALGGWQITVTNQNGYSVTTGPGANTGCTTCPGSPLPVSLVSFEGNATAKGVQLKWVTLSETDNSHFEIERSNDGVRFDFIGKVEGHGTSNETNIYNYTDESPARGVNYFRLKQVDFDGASVYTDIITVKVDGSYDVTISPNPVMEVAKVKLGAVQPNTVIEVISSTGQVVKIVPVNSNTQEVFMGDLANGIYFFRLKSNAATQDAFYKVIKQ